MANYLVERFGENRSTQFIVLKNPQVELYAHDSHSPLVFIHIDFVEYALCK